MAAASPVARSESVAAAVTSGSGNRTLRRWRGRPALTHRRGCRWKSCEPGDGIPEVDPGAPHVGITDDLLCRTHGLANRGPPDLKDLAIQLQVQRRLPRGARHTRRCPHADRTAVGRADERFGETLFREEALEEAVEAVQRDDQGQPAAVGQPGHILGREQVQLPRRHRAVSGVADERRSLAQPCFHQLARVRIDAAPDVSDLIGRPAASRAPARSARR